MVYECRNNHATFSAAYCPTCDAIARAEAAEAAETSLRHEWRDYTRAKVQEFADMQRELNSARAETERLRKQVATLRTALAYYVEARNVTNWGMEEDEDIGDVARAALEATA